MGVTWGGWARGYRRGLWLLGILALLAGAACSWSPTGRGGAGQTRRYFIAAEEVDWDYTPDGRDLVAGTPFGADARFYLEGGPERIGRVYRKAIYREYTDATFQTPRPVPPEWRHLGILGPLIRAEVGDTIVVEFKNNTGIPASIHPHGVYYEKSSEGAPYADGTSGANRADDAVPPGGRHTYTWEVRERSGPGPGDGSSVLWMYHSHTDEVRDVNSGLVGAMIVTARGRARPDGSPKDVDRELVTLFQIFDENSSHYLYANIERFAGDPAAARRAAERHDGRFYSSNLKHTINGFVYGNLRGLTAQPGQRVRWYVLTMGNTQDLHTPHWHGGTLLMGGGSMGMRTDMAEVFPGSMKILDMVPDNDGTWLFHCHVNDHLTAGMTAVYTVLH